MKIQCPKCCAQRPNLQKFGRYVRKSDSQSIQRWKCQKCKKHFSNATFSENYRQNKRRLNVEIRKKLASCVSHRRIAILLKINKKTVRRKQTFLAAKAKRNHIKRMQNMLVESVQFDDLETIEHTKLKPVSVPIIVSEERLILGFGVARIPAKGHLAKISRKKYGPRKNEAPQKREELFEQVKQWIHSHALVESDCHPHYPELIRKHLPNCTYNTYLSERSCIAGQGELKKKKFDPLFKINHTLAMFRANVNRLVRKTWNTTKCLKSLEEHLWVYIDYHNDVLIKKKSLSPSLN